MRNGHVGSRRSVTSDNPNPSELLPLLAESGICGLSLISGPEPEARLAGAGCTTCGEDDVNWLSVEDGSDTAHCDRRGSDFGLVDRCISHPSNRRSGKDTPPDE